MNNNKIQNVNLYVEKFNAHLKPGVRNLYRIFAVLTLLCVCVCVCVCVCGVCVCVCE